MLTPTDPEVEIVKLSINMSVLISWSEFDIKGNLEIVFKICYWNLNLHKRLGYSVWSIFTPSLLMDMCELLYG